jgi:ubiquitin carboxyl-terminal hydrolase 7
LNFYLETRFDEERNAAERLRREHEEQHLMVIVNVVTDEVIRTHHGLDLCSSKDFVTLDDNPKIHSRKLRKDTLVSDLRVFFKLNKADIAASFNLEIEQCRLWMMNTRQNQTKRPDTILTASTDNVTLQEIASANSAKYHHGMSEFTIYLQVSTLPVGHKPDGKPMYFYGENMIGYTGILLFIKYYDPTTGTMEFLSTYTVPKITDKIADIIPDLVRAKGLSGDAKLQLYEEVKPHMVDELKIDQTFEQAEIGNGDIICFQIVAEYLSLTPALKVYQIHPLPQ